MFYIETKLIFSENNKKSNHLQRTNEQYFPNLPNYFETTSYKSYSLPNLNNMYSGCEYWGTTSKISKPNMSQTNEQTEIEEMRVEMEAMRSVMEADKARLASIDAKQAVTDAKKAEHERQLAYDNWNEVHNITHLYNGWKQSQLVADEAKAEYEAELAKNPYKIGEKNEGGVKRHAEGTPERARLDKRYAANNASKHTPNNLFCKFGTGINATAEHKAGGQKILHGCKYCCRSKATMDKHELSCKWANKPRPWENK